MQREVSPYLMTVWPGMVDPLPQAWAPGADLQGEWLMSSGWDRIDVPPELYLGVLGELDLADPQAILEFVRSYGLPATREWRSLGDEASELLASPAPPRFGLEEVQELAGKVRSRLAQGTRDIGFLLQSRAFIHLDELRLHIATLRDMVKLRRIFEGEELGQPTFESPLVRRHDVTTREDAAFVLGTYLTAGLSEFSMWVELRPAEKPIVMPEASTYGVMCLQLANHIAERAPYRRCPACGRLFVRKVDARYQKGQNRVRGGVTYCSSACTNRAARQAHRRRLSAPKGEGMAE